MLTYIYTYLFANKIDTHYNFLNKYVFYNSIPFALFNK
jgi:hypothetical protein